jgi:hypothetical protein
MGHLGEGRGLGLRPWPAEPLLGDVWRVEGVGVPAQHLGGDGEQRRRIDALAGRPICLGGDVALEEPEQKEPEQDAAQLGPIPSATGTCSKNPVTSAAKASGFSCCIGLSLR